MKRICMLGFIFLFGIMLCACGNTSGDRPEGAAELSWQEQYDLGLRYLSEGNYEQAVIAFTAAIEIDPKQAVAYVGRGDAYVGAAARIEASTQERDEHYHKAETDYLASLSLDALMAQVYWKLADIYLYFGDEEAAAAILERARAAGLYEEQEQQFERYHDALGFFDGSQVGIRILNYYFDRATYLAGAPTRFLVTVAYRCPENEDCIVMIGANTGESGKFKMLSSESHAVGVSGIHQFSVTVTPVQWEEQYFGIYVNLSQADHGPSWSPFASDKLYIDENGTVLSSGERGLAAKPEAADTTPFIPEDTVMIG